METTTNFAKPEAARKSGPSMSGPLERLYRAIDAYMAREAERNRARLPEPPNTLYIGRCDYDELRRAPDVRRHYTYNPTGRHEEILGVRLVMVSEAGWYHVTRIEP